VVGLGQFTQVEQNFDSIPAALNLIGGTQAVNKTSKWTTFSLPWLLLLIAFVCTTHFLFGLVPTETRFVFFSDNKKIRQSQCASFVFVVRRFDYLTGAGH